jgi:hypothetical protein
LSDRPFASKNGVGGPISFSIFIYSSLNHNERSAPIMCISKEDN